MTDDTSNEIYSKDYVKKCLERINNVKNEIDNKNKILDTLYNGNWIPDVNIKDKLNNINVEDVLNSYSDYIQLVDPYYIKRCVINSYMKEKWDNLKEDYSTLNKASDFVERMLKCYNFSHRDSYLHDYVWNKHDFSSKLFKIDNKIVFSNSVNDDNINNINDFVDNIVVNIKKYLPNNTQLSWCIKEDNKRNINWVLIILDCVNK
jgi:hypothetical protein